MQPSTILHPTDFSDSASSALRLAAALAVRAQGHLEIYYAETLHAADPANDERALQQYVDTARSLMAAEGAEGEPRLSVKTDRAVTAFDGIMRAAADRPPDLIAMGTHGRTGMSKLLMGSTAEKVLRHAACNVLTVRADARVPAEARFDTILVPVDFSDGAGKALDVARQLRTDTSVLYLVHVVEPVPPMYYAGDVTSRFDLDGELRRRIENSLRDWSGDLDARRLVAEGNPAAETVRVANDVEADLIVISTRGLTGIDRLLVGSVTERVCRMATVPVLVVR